MKVTTELKNLIARQFADKAEAIWREANDIIKKEYTDKVDSVAQMPEFKAFVKAANKFKAAYDAMFADDNYRKKPYAPVNFENRVTLKPDDFVYDATYRMKQDTDAYKSAEKKVKELMLAKEALLIKLAYEKDFDKIQSMLAEYDIKL